jgi:hypothetical protein
MMNLSSFTVLTTVPSAYSNNDYEVIATVDITTGIFPFKKKKRLIIRSEFRLNWYSLTGEALPQLQMYDLWLKWVAENDLEYAQTGRLKLGDGDNYVLKNC